MSKRKPIAYYWERSRWPKTKKFVYDFPLAATLAVGVKTALLPVDRVTLAYYVDKLREHKKYTLFEFIYTKEAGIRQFGKHLYFSYARYMWTNAFAFAINENTQERY